MEHKNKEKVLITGCAGFIGMHLSKALLVDGFEVYGIDNLNDYYEVSLKKNRLNVLKEYKGFTFCKADISDYKTLKKFLKNLNHRK